MKKLTIVRISRFETAAAHRAGGREVWPRPLGAGSRSPHARYLGLLVVAPWLGMLLGCGTGEYRQRVERGLEQVELQAEFDSLQSSRSIGDTPFTIRPPKLFTMPPDVTADVVAERTFAPFGGLPDGDASTWSYEGFIEDGAGGKLPFYLALAVRDMEQFAGQDPYEALRTSLQSVCQESLGGWETVACPTPQGDTVEWKKIRGTGQQEFYYTNADGESMNLAMGGLIEVYAREESGWFVVAGWRMPSSIEQNVNLGNLGPKVAGTLDVSGG